MEIPKQYSPKDVESKWYEHWRSNDYFASKPDEREPYTIVIPPPNVTGVLHMGHMLNNTIQDILIRRARMQGKNACWVPGTDHAAIATENKVIEKLAEEGVTKDDLSREEFLKHAWEWKDKYGGIILKQLERLGASCDWDRTRFTMEDDLYKSVVKVFVDLYKKGLVYRGSRMVNWDPMRKTAVSDEEVYYKEGQANFYTVRYKIVDSDEYITISTTRPETILGDTGICVHPEDERYLHLKGKKAIVPLVNREVPIVHDDYVDIEFGTGALKVTPAHDINDYEIGLRHGLEVIDTLNEDGTLSEAAQLLVGEDRFVARKKIKKLLDEAGALVKVEQINNKLALSERSHAVIEPRMSTQWFLKMEGFGKMALDPVEEDTIEFFPKKAKNTHRHWMENVRDWCISRQLWWGQRIPAYHLPNGKFVVAETDAEALILAQEIDSNLTAKDLKQDEDVLDTWFSSWLWPISVFNGIMEPDNKDIEYYYPTATLVTGADIIFFWVARMIMVGYEYRGKQPFKDVYFTGMVRDTKGRKMSKSLGNSPDALKLLDDYGADGVRTGVLFSSAAGNDLLFDEKQCEQGRNFCNKLWNALRLIKGFELSDEADSSMLIAADWFESKLNATIVEMDRLMDEYRISEALMTVYKLAWDDFCSWYLEMVKPAFGEKMNTSIYNKTIKLYERITQLLHPFMPFITEEMWHIMRDQTTDIMVSVPAGAGEQNPTMVANGEFIKEVVTQVRNIRNEQGIKPKESLELFINAKDEKKIDFCSPIISKLANISNLAKTKEKIPSSKSFIIGTDECFVPVEVNAEDERKRIIEELEHNKGFLASVQKKLSNEKFVSGAPQQVVAVEKQKEQDALTRIEKLEESLSSLS